MPARANDARGIRAFASAIRTAPWVLVPCLFGDLPRDRLGDGERVKTAVEALLLGLVIVACVGYPLFRKRGRLP
jgi:hypothetical protein